MRTKKYLFIFGLLVTGFLIGGSVFNVYFRQYSPAINFSGNEVMVVRVFRNNAKTLIIVGTKNTESAIPSKRQC